MSKAQPATSVHLWWKPTSSLQPYKSVNLECKVKVTNTANHTYFCCVGFQPGGYCGIQQLDGPTKRVAIFSLWNDHQNNAEEVSHGEGVRVSKFGGEGTGLKSMKDFQWETGKLYPVNVVIDEKDDGYYVSCYIAEQYMATYKRKGVNPLSSIYSFVEDFNRWNNPNGYQIERKMALRDMVCTVDGRKVGVPKVQFTKVRDGLDAFGSNYTGAYVDGESVWLWSGGNCPETCTYGECLTIGSASSQ